MRAQLRQIHSPDVHDLRSWVPQDASFALLIQLMVGPVGAPGEESFDLTLCSPDWIAGQVSGHEVLDLRHHTVVSDYDHESIERYFRQRVSACEASTWQQVACRVGRLGYWEFEDYRR